MDDIHAFEQVIATSQVRRIAGMPFIDEQREFDSADATAITDGGVAQDEHLGDRGALRLRKMLASGVPYAVLG